MKYELPRVRRAHVVDMSSTAIASRLQRLDQLFRLGISLRRARLIGPVEPEDSADPRVSSTTTR